MGNATMCDAGFYCPMGSSAPAQCIFTTASCPLSGGSSPNQGAVFIILLIFLVVFLFIFRFCGSFLIKWDEQAKWDKVARAVNTTRNHYDTVNEVVLEHNQLVMIQATENLHENMVAREQRQSINLARAQAAEAGIPEGDEELGVAMSPDAPPLSPPIYTPYGQSLSMRAAASPPAPLTKKIRQSRHRKKSDAVERESNGLMLQLQANMAQYEYDVVKVPFTLSFMHMSLTLKDSGTQVLENVCVAIRPYNVTAIMGPSGAGKTTFLSLLRGQAHYATVSGAMCVNGFPVENLECCKMRTAYVPQEDIVNDALSVEENIVYAALLFNRRGHLMTSEVMPMVLRAERLLDIYHVRTSVVGNATKRGISGGQKKRVSIATELMKEAEMFFLDEPTSGLDSASSMLVISTLHFLASKGVNVSTTIHQPRQEILNLMDNLLLLAPGGRVAYFGPIIDLHEHFSRLHYTCPTGTNIADFVMDTLCGFVPEDNTKEVRDVKDTIDLLCNWWEANRYPLLEAEVERENAELNARVKTTLASLTAPVSSDTCLNIWRFLSFVQFMKVFATCLRRQLRVGQRSMDTVITTCSLMVIFGIIVAFLFGPVSLDSTNAGSLASQMSSGALVFAMLLQAASMKLFSDDQLLRDREFKAGLAIAPYFLGKLLGNFTDAFFYPFAFLTGNYPFIEPRASFLQYWYCYVLLHLAISGLVNFIVIAYPGNNKGTFTVGVVVLLWAFGGLSPTLKTMEDSMSVFATFMNAVSPFTYSFEIEVLNELTQYPETFDTTPILDNFGYQVIDRSSCIMGLLVYFVVMNFVAFVSAEMQPRWPRILKNLQEAWRLARGEKKIRADSSDDSSDAASHTTHSDTSTEMVGVNHSTVAVSA